MLRNRKILALISAIGSQTNSYIQQYKDFLVYAAANGGTPPSSVTNRLKENAFFTALVNNGFWNQIDQGFLLCTNGNNTYSLLDIKRSKNGLAVSSPTFTPGTGWVFNALTQYLNSKFAPSVDGVNFTQNSACIVCFVQNNVAASGAMVDLGGADAALANATVISLFFTGSRSNVRLNASTGDNSTALPSSVGCYIFSRTSSTNIDVTQNGLVVGPLTRASTGRTSKELFVGAYNNNGVAGGFSDKTQAIWLIMSGITLEQHMLLNQIVTDFVTPTQNVTSPTFSDWSNFNTDLSTFLTNAPLMSATVSPAGVLVQKKLSLNVGGYQGLVAAANNCLYAVPSDATQVLKINTSNDAQTLISTSLTAAGQKYGGGVYATNGKIYFCPQSATAVMALDTSNDSSYFFDTTGQVADNASGNLIGSVKWYGIYQGTNGYLYCVPYNATEIMVINPANDAISFIDTAGATTFGAGNLTGSQKWDSGCVYGDYIYGSPSDATDFLKINTSANTCSRFGVVPAGTAKWAISIVGPNGYVYMFPYFDNRVIKLNPATDTFVYLAATIGAIDTTIKICSANYLPDGKILLCWASMAVATSRSRILDTSTDSINLIGGDLYPSTGTNKTFIGGATSKEGAVYMVPKLSSYVIKQYYAAKVVDLGNNFILNRNTHGG